MNKRQRFFGSNLFTVLFAFVFFAGLFPVQSAEASWYTELYANRSTAPLATVQPAPTPVVPSTPTTSAQPTQPGTQPSTITLTADEQKMLDLINTERIKEGRKPLQVDPTLTIMARQKSQDMVDKHYFDHNSPTYGSPFEMMRAAGVQYVLAAENISKANNVYTSFSRLMASPPHRAAMMNARYTHIGIGIVKNNPSGIMVTQEFIQKP